MSNTPCPEMLTAWQRDHEREVEALRAEVERLRRFEADVWKALGTHPDLGCAHSAADAIGALQEDCDCWEETADRHARSIDILAAQNTRQGARLASLENVAGFAQAVVEELSDRGVQFADADFLAMALAADAAVSREPSPGFGPEAVAAVHDIDALRAECERLRARDARTTKRWEDAECVLGYYKGLPIARCVRDRDENEATALAAMREGLAECERLRDEVATLRTDVAAWIAKRRASYAALGIDLDSPDEGGPTGALYPGIFDAIEDE